MVISDHGKNVSRGDTAFPDAAIFFEITPLSEKKEELV